MGETGSNQRLALVKPAHLQVPQSNEPMIALQHDARWFVGAPVGRNWGDELPRRLLRPHRARTPAAIKCRAGCSRDAIQGGGAAARPLEAGPSSYFPVFSSKFAVFSPGLMSANNSLFALYRSGI